MKKVGLMTWFSFNNYGSVLQAFALGEIIRERGYEVEYINYGPKVKSRTLFDSNLKELFDKVLERTQLSNINYIKRNINKKYDIFRKKFKLSPNCFTYTDLRLLCEDYDYIVCGSDQIWSTNAYDENYYLVFSNNNKIAYAPSFGVSDIQDNLLKTRIVEMVKDFKSVSVREENGKKILNNDSIFKALDPTLLLNSDEWTSLLNLNKKYEKKYILCYYLGKKDIYYKVAKQIAKKLNYELYIIPTNEMSIKYKKNLLYDCGPAEFVDYVKNAEMILTDSYHGMLFSINFKKDFIIFERFNNKKESQNSRIYNTLIEFSLENRLYNKKSKDILSHIDYKNIDSKLKKLRIESITFLKKSFDKSDINKKVDDSNKYEITKMCTGCGMCASICPKKCIKIEHNKSGFYGYILDKNKCINCGVCKKICAQRQNNSIILDNGNLYACKSINNEILLKSSSGGVAYELSKLCIKNGMNVIGCTYDYENNIAKHIIINNFDQLKLLSGSKYIQSYTVDAFSHIKDMTTGLIIGTPCQISSVENYLRMVGKRDNFVLVDIICHGIPSYNIWKRLIKNKSINSVNFRDKRFGWHNKVLTINNKKVSNYKFYDFFESNCTYNKCCYDCNYRNKSSADIRIGDFWGKKYEKDQRGMSMAIILTAKGKEYFKKINKNNLYKQIEQISDYSINQQHENISLPIEYYSLMNDLSDDNKTTSKIHKKYCKKIILDKKIRQIFNFLNKKI